MLIYSVALSLSSQLLMKAMITGAVVMPETKVTLRKKPFTELSWIGVAYC